MFIAGSAVFLLLEAINRLLHPRDLEVIDIGIIVMVLSIFLTAILIALGEGERLVGVDDFSARQIPSVAELPRVGGLFNPSLEAVVALEPDLVVTKDNIMVICMRISWTRTFRPTNWWSLTER